MAFCPGCDLRNVIPRYASLGAAITFFLTLFMILEPYEKYLSLLNIYLANVLVNLLGSEWLFFWINFTLIKP